MAIVAANCITSSAVRAGYNEKSSRKRSRSIVSTRVARCPVTGYANRRTREAIASASAAAWVLAAALVGQDSSLAATTAVQAEREKLATQDIERIQKSEFVQGLLRKSQEKK